MSHTPTKKSVFDRIGGSSSSGTTNVSNKSVCLDFDYLLFFSITKKKINICLDTWILQCICEKWNMSIRRNL
jgi:hypothetical protein